MSVFSFFFLGGGHTAGYLFIKNLKYNKICADVSISENIQYFDNFIGFCS